MELAENIAYIILNGTLLNNQRLGDAWVGITLGHQFQHPHLLLGQVAQGGQGGTAHQVINNSWIHHHLAIRGGLDGPHQLLDAANCLFE